MVRPKRGDRVRIVWVDIFEDCTASPENVKPKVCRSLGYWLGYHTLEIDGLQVRYVLTSDTEMEADHMGATAYPKGCVVSVEVLK